MTRSPVYTLYISNLRKMIEVTYTLNNKMRKNSLFPGRETFAPRRKENRRETKRNISKRMMAESLREISVADIPGSPRIFKCQRGSTRLTRFNGWKYYSRSYISDVPRDDRPRSSTRRQKTEKPKPWGEKPRGLKRAVVSTNDEGDTRGAGGGDQCHVRRARSCMCVCVCVCIGFYFFMPGPSLTIQ